MARTEGRETIPLDFFSVQAGVLPPAIAGIGAFGAEPVVLALILVEAELALAVLVAVMFWRRSVFEILPDRDGHRLEQ